MKLHKLGSLSESVSYCAMGEMAAKCLAARTAMHVAHLSSRNYAEHIALGEFYEAIGALIDGVVEAYMGATAEMLVIPAVLPDQKTPALDHLRALRSDVVLCRSSAASGATEIENMIDEILSLIDKTCYKLRFLS